jgi:hypothetical protein
VDSSSDWKTWLVSPLLAIIRRRNGTAARMPQENGFSLEEEGTQFSTLYFLAKQDVTRASDR